MTNTLSVDQAITELADPYKIWQKDKLAGLARDTVTKLVMDKLNGR